jgi:hypothetical protein
LGSTHDNRESDVAGRAATARLVSSARLRGWLVHSRPVVGDLSAPAMATGGCVAEPMHSAPMGKARIGGAPIRRATEATVDGGAGTHIVAPCVTGLRAVTRGAVTENAAVFLALRANNYGNLQCQHNDAFSNTPNYPWRLRFSRAPCQALLAYVQRILAVSTKDETMLTSEPLFVLSFHTDIKENHPQPRLIVYVDSADWTAHRLTVSRALVAQTILAQASMSQLRSVVLVTPRFATVNRVGLNTYRHSRLSSKHPVVKRCQR